MLTRILSAFLIIILWLIYPFYVTHSSQNQAIVGMIIAFNEILSKNVYVGNRLRSDINRLRLIPEDDYCQRSDLLKFFHPDMILEDIYSLRDVIDLTRTIMRKMTFETTPQLDYSRYEAHSIYKLAPQISMLYPYYETVSEKLVTGKCKISQLKEESMCLFQKQNHMHGKHQLSLKQKLMNNFYSQIDLMRSLNLTQDCIDNATYIPITYRLYNKLECTQFFELVNTEEFQNITKNVAPQFITKLGNEVHRGRGINVLFPTELNDLQQIYEYGKKCGKDLTSLVAQRYISNPYLYKKHKIEFRIYWFLASTNPMIAYSYKRPLIKRCAKPFDLLSTEKAAHVCNTAIVKQTMDQKKAPKNDDNIEEEEFFIDWSFEGLQDRLVKEGKINDTKWLNDTLYPLIYTKLIHLVRSAQNKFQKDSRLGEFFATDFILSDDLQIFVLETNYNPQVLSVTPDRIARNYKMIMDTVEIMNVYLRSRYIRIKELMQRILNKSSKSKEKNKINELIYSNSTKQEFLNIYKDKLDRGYYLSPNNLYHKYIDESFSGEKIYNGLVQKKCMYQIGQ